MSLANRAFFNPHRTPEQVAAFRMLLADELKSPTSKWAPARSLLDASSAEMTFEELTCIIGEGDTATGALNRKRLMLDYERDRPLPTPRSVGW